MLVFWLVVLAVVVFAAALVIYDVRQRQHAILHNFPIIGHFRYLLESVGPELRQYIVTSNTEERPFNRDQRSWVYRSAKGLNNYFGYGTSEDLEGSPNYLIVKHSAFPLEVPHSGAPDFDPAFRLPAAKIIGERHQRKGAFRPDSVVNISGMSFGSLSGAAVVALNRGAKLAGCMQSTGEGSLSPYHQEGGDLVWQIGTGYFGARDAAGRFDLAKAVDVVAANPVKMIEVKLSQGAKPGLGGVLPGKKVTPEIAAIRGVAVGKDCISPSAHTAFHDIDSMIEFVEKLADATGVPVGIKSAVGEIEFWVDLAQKMASSKVGVDFITIDGGEGGTGAAPLVFSDHVALPFKIGFSRVYRTFAEQGIAEEIAFIGSGKLGFPETALLAFALGCDMVNVGREAMLSIGCIQAQRCHTDRCPTGVTTQNKWLARGLDPAVKAPRAANYVMTLRKELIALSRACGVPHPSLVTASHLEVIDDRFRGTEVEDLLDYQPGWGLPPMAERDEIARIMKAMEKG